MCSIKDDLMIYLENCDRITYIESIPNGVLFIFENVQFTVDFAKDTYEQLCPYYKGKASDLIKNPDLLLDNIEFAERFGILDKEKYMDQIFRCTGW